MSEQLHSVNSNIEALQRYVYPTLKGVNIVSGCGTRPCVICSENSPGYQSSMDFDVLSTILSTYSGYQGSKPLMLFGKGDPAYYRNRGQTLKDVFELAHNTQVRVNARTHGCLHTDTKTLDSVASLVDYVTGNGLGRSSVALDMSIDGYGWIGVSKEDHLASIATFYDVIAPLDPIVFAFSNEHAADGEQGSHSYVYQLAADAHIPERQMFDQGIYYYSDKDRPSRIVPKPPHDRSSAPWRGTFIEADGTILYNHPTLNVISCGNIFRTIFTQSLPQPDGGY